MLISQWVPNAATFKLALLGHKVPQGCDAQSGAIYLGMIVVVLVLPLLWEQFSCLCSRSTGYSWQMEEN